MSEPDTHDDDIQAARYALGVADLAEVVAAEARMAEDSGFARRVARYDAALYALEPGTDSVDLPGDSWDRIAAAIADGEKAPNTRTVRTAELAWESFIPGVERKIVSIDKAASTQIALYRVAPGASVPTHLHCVTEECLVLDGEIEIGGIVVPAGDVHLAFNGSRHGPVTSPRGALLYIRSDLQMRA